MDTKVTNIFLAEDNPGDVILLEERFKDGNLPYNIDVASNGEEAVAKLDNLDEAPDIILLDINLPRLDGIQVLRNVKESDVTSKTPVLMLTSSKHSNDIERAKAAGANGFITKPGNFNVYDFLTFIDAVEQNPNIWIHLEEK